MSLRAAAESHRPATGRPSLIGTWRDGLKPKQCDELDALLADRSFSDAVIVRAIEDTYGVTFSAWTIGNFRKARRLR